MQRLTRSLHPWLLLLAACATPPADHAPGDGNVVDRARAALDRGDLSAAHALLREQLIREVEIIPIEVVIRNIAAGSIAKRFALSEGTQLPRPIVEYFYKDDDLGDPMINDEHILIFSWATREELDEIHRQALAVNAILEPFMRERGVLLVDFKLEFGRDSSGKVLLADEICPDTCRFWDIKTRKKLDKDRFRQDLGGVEDAYQEIARRVAG